MKTMHDMAKDVVRRYGRKKQLDIIQEECAELITAISHYKRGRKDAIEEVVEETADVAFMIHQLKNIFFISSDEIEFLTNMKYEKLMEKEEQKNV